MTLFLIATLGLYADTIALESLIVEATMTTQIVKDVSGEDIKSADLADALAKHSPSVSLVRRSGIANDIRIRGQKKDNINISIDGAKVHGACPNRMDPPISHVLTNNIDYIEINEGPFSVEDFGVLSADVKIHTLKPKKEFEGELNLGLGDFGYRKSTLSMSGGIGDFRILFSASTETGKQYKDGNGDDFVGQIANNIANGIVSPMAQYQDEYKSMNSFSKKTIMTKIFWDISDTQVLKLGYTQNNSDKILYPSSKMDALYDDSTIYTLDYTISDLSKYSKALTVQAYHSAVEHPMSTKYRNMGARDFMTHKLSTQTQGLKIKNRFDSDAHQFTIGIDASTRNWDGGYYQNSNPFPQAKFHSIWDVDTENIAVFIEDKMTYDMFSIDWGMRYDMTEIHSANPTQNGNNYDILNGYVLAKYKATDTMEYFIGLGKSSRVPDAKELYWIGKLMSLVHLIWKVRLTMNWI
jgi:iron complex outermembrane receptor protein